MAMATAETTKPSEKILEKRNSISPVWQFFGVTESDPQGGPDAVSMNITPAVVLLNGTYYTIQGSEVTYTCSSQSYPAQELSWVFEGLASKPLNVTSGNRTSLSFKKINIIPIDQGNYSCSARNPVSGKTVTSSIAVLVYYRPSRAPRCSSQTGNNASDLLLLCSWTGGYPEPTLQWKHDDEETPGDWQPVPSASAANASLDVTINRTQLHDGQVLKCVGEHPAVLSRMELSCSVKLTSAYNVGGLIGVVLAIVIAGSGGIIGAVVYLNRERIFLGHRVWSEERNDVLMLVDSDDDAPFEDDVSGLTSVTNGNATPVVNDQHTTRDDPEEPQVHDEEPREDITDT